MAFDLIGEIGAYPFKAVIGAFRYVFSSKFRSETHKDWKSEPPLYIFGVIIFCAVFTLATFIALGSLVAYLFSQS
jgi:hypothetical protein